MKVRTGVFPQPLVYWLIWTLATLPTILLFRWNRYWIQGFPRRGGTLLLANHTSALDPVWIGYWIWRRISFMASAHLLRLPYIGATLLWCGCFPKEKFIKDRDSMKVLQQRYDAGDVITIFPEGERTWDGRPGVVLPGIGRLIKRLNAQVVNVRILNGHLFHPRWAKYPRFVPIRLEYNPVMRVNAEDTPEQLAARVADEIRIDHEAIRAPRFSWGWRLAHGLENYLWACPHCFAVGGLKLDLSDGDRIGCHACDAVWRVDVSARMNPVSGPAELMSVPTAFDRMAAHFGPRPVVDSQAWEAWGEVLSVEGARLLLIDPERGRTPLGVGRLLAHRDGLRWEGDSQVEIPWTELRTVSMEVADTLQIRHGDRLIRVNPGADSTLKWGYFLRQWRQAHLPGAQQG